MGSIAQLDPRERDDFYLQSSAVRSEAQRDMSSVHVAWSEGAGGPITVLEIPLLVHSQGLRGCPLSRPDATLFGRSSLVGQLSAPI